MRRVRIDIKLSSLCHRGAASGRPHHHVLRCRTVKGTMVLNQVPSCNAFVDSKFMSPRDVSVDVEGHGLDDVRHPLGGKGCLVCHVHGPDQVGAPLGTSIA